MSYQTQSGAYLAFKAQSALGTAASGSGATVIPINTGSARVTKNAINSNQVRSDGMALRGRHGLQASSLTLTSELQLDNFDDLLAALMRASDWTTSPVITQATGAMSSATLSVSGSTITFSGGSVITSGLRLYDVVVFTAGLDSADNNQPLRVTALTATTITVAESLTTVAGPVSTYSFSAKTRVLTNPAAGSLVKTYFTIEECNRDIDSSIVLQDMRISRLNISMAPDGIIMFDTNFVGTGEASVVSGGSSPYFTSPTETTKTVMAALDASVRTMGSSGSVADRLDLTAFNMTIDLNMVAPGVAASTVSPDVFDGIMTVGGSITVLTEALGEFSAFLAESDVVTSIIATELNSSPTNFFSMVVPYHTLGSADLSSIRREGGPRTTTINIPPALVGVDPGTSATGHQTTLVKFQTSNA